MLAEADTFRAQDDAARAVVDARNALHEMALFLSSIMRDPKATTAFTKEERGGLREALAATVEWMEEGSKVREGVSVIERGESDCD